jgi:ferredoxin-NADP reductase/DMSO/TMAO reductase YedYZ heme-binding membrane subunit
VLLGLLLLGALLGSWPVLLPLSDHRPLDVVPLVAHVAGMLAGYGVLMLLLLMARWPVLERFGSDTLARWHARAGRLVLALVVVHAVAAVAAVGLWRVIGLPWLVAATVGTGLLVVVGVCSARAARRRVSYETWHALHLLTYAAVALSFLHQLAGPDLAGHRSIQLLWSLLYAHTFALVLRHRVLAPLRAAVRHRLRVEAVVPEAPGVVSIVLAGEHLDELSAEPGQFFRWRFLTPDTWRTAHPFSLSAPPTATHLRLTVKALGDGSRLLQGIDVGTWVAAEGPYGALTAARRTRRDVLLLAGGVGITPMRALFETLPIERDQELMLVYRARCREEIVFRDELDELAERRRARVVYVLGEDPELLSAAALTRLVPGLAARDVYLCGPPGLSAGVRRSLAAAGLPRGQLHEERFSF